MKSRAGRCCAASNPTQY